MRPRLSPPTPPTTKLRLMMIFRVVAVLTFGASALLQWNDPDPLVWIAVYASAAATAGAAVFGQPRRLIPAGLALVCAVWMVTLLSGLLDFVGHGDLGRLTESMHADAPDIEQAREFLGLALIVLYAIVELASTSRAQRSR